MGVKIGISSRKETNDLTFKLRYKGYLVSKDSIKQRTIGKIKFPWLYRYRMQRL